MELADIEEIAVLGAGSMGHGIAEVAAIAGYPVALRDIEDELVEEGIERIEWSLDKLVEHDRLTADEAEAARENVTGVVDLGTAVGDADFVIEAVPERMDVKGEVYRELSDAAPEHAIFASNTSSLSITALAAETDRPDRVCGMHFFNPPVRMDLVEVIAGDETAPETLEVTEALAGAFGKTTVRVEKDVPGFIVNRILTPVLNEAAWMVHEGEATIAEVDSTAVYELGLPMGTFELADLVGIDVCLDVLSYIHQELGAAYEPCPLLEEKAEAGELGQKSGAGFYSYDDGDDVEIPPDAGSTEIADRLVAMMANEAAKLREDEVADLDAIDTAVELGLGFPDGPIAMADERGIDGLVDVLQSRYDETDHERYAVSPTLATVAERGGFRGDQDSAGVAASFDDLRIERPSDHVGAIVIDRSHRMNALTPTVLEELPQAIDRFEGDEDVRAILLRGEGDRAFSAGADIGGMSSVLGDSQDAVDLSRTGQAAFGRLEETELPVIAAIDGYCLGGGMELATAADLRIASERSTFGQTELDLGLLPGWGGTQRLARIVGEGRAKEITYTADHYDAGTMADYGFVNRVVENDILLEEAEAWAEEIAAGPPIAQGLLKRAIHAGRNDEQAGLEVEALAFGQLTQTDDLMEGISAFMEDRKPEFEGT